MMRMRIVFFVGLLMLYTWGFTTRESLTLSAETPLELAFPVTFQTIAAGYMKQLAAEMLFIKTSVFLSGLQIKMPPEIYADALANNFQVMSSLYPRFIDPYYFCESFLPSISPDSAAKANSVLETGIRAYPDDLIFRFYYGTNFFLWMNEPLKGAKAFEEAAQLPNAPQIFTHLTAILSAQGGEITAGYLTLQKLIQGEKDETILFRYKKEKAFFEQALQVNDALIAYQKKYKAPPDDLNQLVPEFLAQIPEFKDTFVLVYNKPVLRLLRPPPAKK